MTDPPVTSPSLTLEDPPVVQDPVVAAPFSAPSPAEVLLVLAKSQSPPRWRQWYGPSARPVPVEREQASLALGVIGVEMLVAGHARDGQQVIHMLADAAAIEKTLGIAEPLRARHTRLPTLAAGNQWETFRQEVEALQQEQTDAFAIQRDPDLGRLLRLGSWLRALDLETAVIGAAGTPPPALTALAHDLLDWLEAELDALSGPVQKARSVGRCRHLAQRLRRLPAAESAEPRHVEVASQLLSDTVNRFFSS
jgi:hypothetical protein